MKSAVEQCIRDWFVAEAETLKLVSAMVTRYRQGGPLEDAHQRLADAVAKRLEPEPSPEEQEEMRRIITPIPVKRGPGRPRKIIPETRP